jgi:predicted metal-dependent hydrolase
VIPETPDLAPDEQEAFDRGVDQFNAGYFFECHDTLEELWGGLRGPSRDFFQGLIQVSVAFYHLTRGNEAGAESMLSRALTRFAAYPPRYFGFDLDEHRATLTAWLARIRSGGVAEPALAELPKWRFEARGAPATEPGKGPQ